MQFLFPKPSMPRPDQVLPGRAEAIVQPRPHFVNGRSLTPPYPDGLRGRGLRHGLLLGRREGVLVHPGRLGHGRRLPGRHHAQPDLPGVVHRQDRPCRGRSRGLRPVDRLVRAAAEDVLGVARPDAGLPAGQRRRHGVPVGDLHPLARPAGRRHGIARHVRRASWPKARFGEITTEIREAPAFYFAEDYHQQYLAKNPNGYCPNHRTGVMLPDVVVTPLQYAE